MQFILFPPGLIGYPTAAIHEWEHDCSVSDVELVVRTADSLGYDYLSMPDHIVQAADHVELMGKKWPEQFATLAYFAAITKNIQLYTNVNVVPHRSPILMAKTVATIDWLSGGRMALGLGAGHSKSELGVLGVPFEQRGTITNEYILAMKELWTNEVASFHGDHVSFDEIVCDPRPVRKPHPPIFIGGNSRPAMRRAAALGDGWAPWLVEPRELPGCIDYLYSQPGLRDNARPFEIVMPLSRMNVDDVTHDVLGDTIIPGAENEVMEELATLQKLGTTGILTFFPATSSLNEYIERITWFAQDVMPSFRD